MEPKNHVIPTQEELDAGIQAALDAKEDPEVVEENEVIEDKPVIEEKNEQIPEVKPDETPKEEEKIDQEQTDYKKKFVSSSQEAQILAAKQKKINEAIEAAKNTGDPTEDELKNKYRDWDLMDDTMKSLAKDNLLNERRFDTIYQASQEGKDVEKWQVDVNTFIEDPKTLIANPDLEGKGEDFKLFATRPTRRGSDFETLVSAFLFEHEKTKVKHVGKMFETPVGGPNDKPTLKSNKISVEESIKIRETDYNKYAQLLKDNMIEDIV